MTKADLVRMVSEKTKSNIGTTEKIVTQTIKTIKESIEEGETIYIRKFGSFSPKRRAAKKGQCFDPGKKTVIIPAKTVPHFKPSPSFKLEEK